VSSKEVKTTVAAEVRNVGLMVVAAGQRWLGYEILSDRSDVLATLTASQVETLGEGLADWGAIDAYGVLLAGPAWKAGLLSNADILRWTQSADFWRRRAALVSTVVCNTRSRGGVGDAERTLMICKRLIGDKEDMVVKALSWALRALVPWDRDAVEAFIDDHDALLASRVKREVRNKLQTGLKSTTKPKVASQ
jgi:DNA alkylation repair enzyme